MCHFVLQVSIFSAEKLQKDGGKPGETVTPKSKKGDKGKEVKEVKPWFCDFIAVVVYRAWHDHDESGQHSWQSGQHGGQSGQHSNFCHSPHFSSPGCIMVFENVDLQGPYWNWRTWNNFSFLGFPFKARGIVKKKVFTAFKKSSNFEFLYD